MRIIGICAGALALAACGSTAEQRAAPPGSAPFDGSPNAPVIAVTVPVAAAAAPTSALAAVDLIDTCVAVVQYGALTGDPAMADMWNEADHDVSALTSTCMSLGARDPSALADMSAHWADIETSGTASHE